MKNLLQFLDELSKNNNKPWFDDNRKRYENDRKDFIQFVSKICGEMSKFDPLFNTLDPKKCIFRINRDIRFSSNKNPYKNNMGAWFSTKIGEIELPGYYLHLEPNNKSFIAGGSYMPPAELLKKLRQEIDYNLDTFENILNNPVFKSFYNELGGDKLSRPPKGYEKDNPAIEYLKHKSFVVMHPLTDKEVENTEILLSQIVKGFQLLIPFNQFLNQISE